MMTAKKLNGMLKDSGTGKTKLDAAEAWIKDNPDASGTALLNAMVSNGQWPDGTVSKARKMLAESVEVKEGVESVTTPLPHNA